MQQVQGYRPQPPRSSDALTCCSGSRQQAMLWWADCHCFGGLNGVSASSGGILPKLFLSQKAFSRCRQCLISSFLPSQFCDSASTVYKVLAGLVCPVTLTLSVFLSSNLVLSARGCPGLQCFGTPIECCWTHLALDRGSKDTHGRVGFSPDESRKSHGNFRPRNWRSSRRRIGRRGLLVRGFLSWPLSQLR